MGSEHENRCSAPRDRRRPGVTPPIGEFGGRQGGQAGSGKMSRAVIVMVSESSGVTTSDRAHTM
jgi:hypothetical protein